jgi:heptosyltransferase-2
MTTPALLRLRERFPRAHLALLTAEKLAPLWSRHPALDAVLVRQATESNWAVARRLRTENFDTAVVLPNSIRAALEMWLAGIPRRIGYGRRWRNLFLTESVPPRAGRVAMRKRGEREIRRLIDHAIDRAESSRTPDGAATPTRIATGVPPPSHQVYEYLHLAAALGANPSPLAPHLEIGDAESKSAEEKFDLAQILHDGRAILGLNPGAEYGPAKRWPLERFITAAKEIQSRTGCAWLLFGRAQEYSMCAAIEKGLSDQVAATGTRGSLGAVRNLAGETSLRELMALLKLCRVLLTNDSGPMHLAAALGRPVVVPFGSTSPELTGPLSAGAMAHQVLRRHVPCAPCFRRVCPIDLRCLKGIAAERAVAAVLEILG